MTSRQARHLLLQLVRRCVQLSAVALIAALAFIGLYHHWHHSLQLDSIESIEGWRGEVLEGISDRFSELERPDTVAERFNGNLWSMRIAGVEITDPLALAEASAADRSLHLPLLIGALGPILLALLLGRVFCSWICPGYLLFEVAGKLRVLLRLGQARQAKVRFAHRNKYLMLGVGLIIVTVTGLPLFSLFYPPLLISRGVHALIFGTALVGGLTILLVMLVVEIFVSPRWWCRSMCPGGGLYALLGAARPVRVTCDAERCTLCGECEPVCEEGIHPTCQCSGMECDNCGVCIRHCPEDALGFTLGLPGRFGKRGVAPAGAVESSG